MSRAFPSPRRVAAVLGLLVASVAVPTGVLGQSADPAAETPSTAILSQDGWWNRAQGPQEGEPEAPVRPVIGGTLPAPSTVPPNGLGVGALLGEPDKVAAVGFVLEAPLDAFVDQLTLTLKESDAANANANAAGAAIVACPITDFWAGVKNGDYVRRPECDDGESVPGVRAADGTWTFDLTGLGASWLDGTLMQNGVLLHEAVEPPVAFQVSFGDLTTGTIKIDFATTGGGFSASSDFTFDDTAGATDFSDTGSSGFDDGGGFALDDSASFDSSSSDFSSSGSSFSSGATTSRTGAAAPAGAAAPPAAQTATPVASGTQTIAATRLFGNLPVPAIVFLVLLLVGAALFLGLVVGPLATPAAVPVRSGGVSRALAARDDVASTRR